MRRLIFRALGVLELLSALILFGFVWSLPGPADVHERVGRVENVGQQTSLQVAKLRQQVGQIREKQPQARQLAEDMRVQLKDLGAGIEKQHVNPDTLRTMHDSLGYAAKGLDDMSDALAPDGFAQIGAAMLLTADYLDKQVCPAADSAADRLDKSVEALRRNARNLAELLRTAPPDLKTAREVHDSLAKFGTGLDHLSGSLRPEHIVAMREGLQGLERALMIAAERVALLAGYTYPVVKLQGYKPQIDYRKFWPEGGEVAEGLYKAAKGSAAARKELEQLATDLPKLREAVLECRVVVDRTRQSLGLALEQQVKLEALLKSVPEHAARLSEELPKMGEELSHVLRETAKLRAVATLLRGAYTGLDQSMKRWPMVRGNLHRSSELLRDSQKKMKYILDHREEYDRSVKNSHRLIDTLSEAVPLYTEQVGQDLESQEQSLANLGTSVDQVNAVLPEVATSGARLLVMTRLLLSLLGAISLLHGSYVIAHNWKREPALIS